jgi:hypothetical protein
MGAGDSEVGGGVGGGAGGVPMAREVLQVPFPPPSSHNTPLVSGVAVHSFASVLHPPHTHKLPRSYCACHHPLPTPPSSHFKVPPTAPPRTHL